MHILMIENKPDAAADLAKRLEEQKYVVDIVFRGHDGLQRAKSFTYDLIILDIVLPQMDGWTVLSTLRRMGNQTPVLFLTAKDAIEDRVRGLELGADDYLVKPFEFSELLARIRTVLRRGAPGRHPEMIQIAGLEIDLPRNRVFREGRKLELTQKEFQLLCLFARRPGKILTRTIIAEEVWDATFDSNANTVNVHIRRLRAKVDGPFPVKLIQTVRGKGYLLDVDH